MSASQAGMFNFQAIASDGDLGEDMRLYTYTAGTTTFKAAYTEPTGVTAHTYTSDGIGGQYIACNARGELPAPLFLTSGAYDLCLKTPAGSTVWTRRAEGQDDSAATLDTAVRADLALTSNVAKGDALIGLKRTASGAVAGTLHSWHEGQPFNAKTDFGAVGDGTTDDTTALQNWLSAGKNLYLPAGVYKHTAKLLTTAGCTIFGAGAEQSTFKKFFNGDQIDWASGVAFVDIAFDGNGASYTGSNAVISTGSHQSMLRCYFLDAETNPIRFTAANVGTYFSFMASQIRSATYTNGGLLFHASDTADNTKGTMVNIDCVGGNLFDIGSGAVGALKAIGCTSQGVTFGDNGVNIALIGCRLATYDVHVKGTNTQIYGCAISEDLYLDGSATGCVIGPNVLAGGKAIINNSLHTNEIYGMQSYQWTPVLSLVNSLGNGSLSGRYSRNGNTVTATVSFVAGSTTTFNAGTFTCSLPHVTTGGGTIYVGSVRALDSGTNFRTGVWINSPSDDVGTFFHDTATAQWSNTSPFTWANGDTLQATITYETG